MEFIIALVYGISGIAATVLALDMFLHFIVQKTFMRKLIAVIFFLPTALIAVSALSMLVK